MVTKDKWLKQDEFDRAFGEVRAEVGIDNINGNMVINALGTSSRSTAYAMFRSRMAAEQSSAAPATFVLPETDLQKGAAMLASIVTGIVETALATKNQQLAALERQVSGQEQAHSGLIAVLVETEAERDQAREQVDQLEALIAAHVERTTRLEAQIEILRDGVIGRIAVARKEHSSDSAATMADPGPLFSTDAGDGARP